MNTGEHALGLVSESMLENLSVPGDTPAERTLNFYSERRPNAQLKVAPDDAIAGLREFYSAEGFDDWSGPGSWNGDGRSAITVTIDGVTHTMSQPPGGDATTPEKMTKYFEFVQLFQEVYNQVLGYQNLSERPTFEKPVLSDDLKDAINASLGLGGR